MHAKEAPAGVKREPPPRRGRLRGYNRGRPRACHSFESAEVHGPSAPPSAGGSPRLAAAAAAEATSPRAAGGGATVGSRTRAMLAHSANGTCMSAGQDGASHNHFRPAQRLREQRSSGRWSQVIDTMRRAPASRCPSARRASPRPPSGSAPCAPWPSPTREPPRTLAPSKLHRGEHGSTGKRGAAL